MKRLWNNISYYLLMGLCKAVGYLPEWFLYHGIASFIYFILYKVVGYRVAVTRRNLANSFPEMTETERRNIERRFYHHLAEVFVDTVRITAISEKDIRRHFTYDNIDLPLRGAGAHSWIAAMAHYGSWEYTINFKLLMNGHDVLAVYRPLQNSVFERFYQHMRSRFGVNPVAMGDVMRETIKGNRKGATPVVIAMIGDQTPPIFEQRHWYTFLNQDTSFFAGMGKMALKFRMPVYFLHINKIRPGYYRSRFIEIYDGREDVSEHDIMKRYVTLLEAMIRETPELWMWSHRRWKHKRRVPRAGGGAEEVSMPQTVTDAQAPATDTESGAGNRKKDADTAGDKGITTGAVGTANRINTGYAPDTSTTGDTGQPDTPHA